MSYLTDHLQTCDYCRNKQQSSRPTIRIKLASSKPTIHIRSRSDYIKNRKLLDLGSIIKGTSYPSVEPLFQTKGASEIARKPGPIEREMKLKALGKMVRG